MEEEFSSQISSFLDPTKSINESLSTSCCNRQSSSSSCPFHQPLIQVMSYIQTIGRNETDADKKMAKLILSGLIPACLHVIDSHSDYYSMTQNDNNNNNNKTKEMCSSVGVAKAIIHAATETDTPWTFINVVRDHTETKASEVGGFLGSDVNNLQKMLSRHKNATKTWCHNKKNNSRRHKHRNDSNTSSSRHSYHQPAGSDDNSGTSLIGLALMKILVFSIRHLAALDDDDNDDDGRLMKNNKNRNISQRRNCHRHVMKEELTFYITRLIARCLSREAEEEHTHDYDRQPVQQLSDSERLLVAGSNEQKWIEAAAAAQKEYDSEIITSCYLSKDALVRILQPPSYQDRSLFRWILRPDVFNAVEGWIHSGTWKHHHHLGAPSPPSSWKRFRALLIIGAKGNSSMTANIMSTYTMTPSDYNSNPIKNYKANSNEETLIISTLDHQTLAAAAELRTRSHEKHDGSKFYICSAMGCHKHTSMKRCSNCMMAQYCSIRCQLNHWKQAHQHECKVLSSSQECS